MVRTFCLLAAFVGLTLASWARADEPKVDQNAMKPGKFHEKLDPMAGEFDFTIKFWMDPSAAPMESKGTSTTKWIMGKRFLEQTVKADFAGMPFEGKGLTGYDNLEQKYVYSWVDNMTTGLMTGKGTPDKSGKVITYVSEFMDPMTGKRVKEKDVSTIIDNDHHKSEFYRINGDKEVKVMEITYTRKK